MWWQSANTHDSMQVICQQMWVYTDCAKMDLKYLFIFKSYIFKIYYVIMFFPSGSMKSPVRIVSFYRAVWQNQFFFQRCSLISCFMIYTHNVQYLTSKNTILLSLGAKDILKSTFVRIKYTRLHWATILGLKSDLMHNKTECRCKQTQTITSVCTWEAVVLLPGEVELYLLFH